MVELENIGDGAEALLEVGNLQEKDQYQFGYQLGATDLLEVVAELDNGGLTKLTVGVHDKLAMLERVQVAGDQQEIRAALDWQEAATGNIDTVSSLEVLDGGANGGL